MLPRKSLSAALAALILAVTLPAVTHADVDDDLDELRGTSSYNEWQLVKNDARRNIRAWSKREDGKEVRSFKLDYLVDAPFMTLARVYLDIESYTRWFWTVREARILKKVSPTEFYYYVQHDAPVTLPDRDAVIRVTVDPYTPKKGYGALKLKAVPDFIPPKPPLVRMDAEDMVVKFTPSAPIRYGWKWRVSLIRADWRRAGRSTPCSGRPPTIPCWACSAWCNCRNTGRPRGRCPSP